MRILTPTGIFICIATMYLSSHKINAQEKTTTLNQDPKFEQLLNEKRKINTSITINDRYKIQIFSGESEKAKKELADYKFEFRNSDATIVFNTPNYKVWIGNYSTRMEAERNLVEIKKRYQNVLLIKPNRS
jgi:hypothetical protein